MKFFVPAVGYRIRLIKDWSFELYHEHRNDALLAVVAPKLFNNQTNRWSWTHRYDDNHKLKSTPTSLPAGTILEVDRVYVRTINKTAQSKDDDYDSLTFKIIDQTTKGKKRFWVKLSDANNIEYELPENFDKIKERARENAGKLKKLTPKGVADIISSVVMPFYSLTSNPSWYDSDLIKSFKEFGKEYASRQRPVEERRIEKMKAYHDAQMRRSFTSGTLSIPISLKSKIRTYEDYVIYVDPNIATRFNVNEQLLKWEYIISNFIDRYGVSVALKTTRDAEKRLVRKWRGVTSVERQSRYENDEVVDFSDMWIEVISNQEDTMIVDVRCGFEKKAS